MNRKTIDILSIKMAREKVIEYETTVRSPIDIANVAKSLIEESVQEEVWGFYLNNRGKIVCARMIGRGTVSECAISPIDVYRPCFLTNAVSVILVHNHPSGDSAPSEHDKLLAMRLGEAGRILGLKLLDFIITADNVYSFRENEIL